MRLMYIDVVGVHVTPACSLQPWSHDAIDHLRRCRKRPRDLHVAVAVGSVGSDLKKTMQIWCEKSMANLLCEKIRHHRSIMIYLLFALSWSLMPYEVQLDNSWIFSYLFHLHGNRFIANTLLIAHEKFHAEAVVRRLRPGAAPAQLTPSLKSGSIADIAANCSKSIVFWQNFGEVGSDRQKHLNYLNCNFMTFLVEQAWLQKFAALRCASGRGCRTCNWPQHAFSLMIKAPNESEQIQRIRRSDRQNDTVYIASAQGHHLYMKLT